MFTYKAVYPSIIKEIKYCKSNVSNTDFKYSN